MQVFRSRYVLLKIAYFEIDIKLWFTFSNQKLILCYNKEQNKITNYYRKIMSLWKQMLICSWWYRITWINSTNDATSYGRVFRNVNAINANECVIHAIWCLSRYDGMGNATRYGTIYDGSWFPLGTYDGLRIHGI